jgi:ribonuclease Z
MQRNFIKAGLGMNRKMKIFITHLHSDHCVGLLGLLQTLSLQGRTTELDLYGQPRLKDFILENMRIIEFGLGFEVKFHAIEEEGIVAKEADYQVTCCKAIHSIPALAYCLEEFDRPGIFNVARAKELGLPEGDLFGKIQRGEDVTYDGRLIRSVDLLGPPRKGRKICFSGDTRPDQRLANFFKNSDILIYESTYGQQNQSKAIEYGHSTAAEAAAMARQAGAKMLYLTHFSARYEATNELVAEASKIHPNVRAADDLLEITIPYTG